MQLAPVAEALAIAVFQCGQAAQDQLLRTGDRTVQRVTVQVALGWPRQMAVPDIAKSVVEADALEAMVQLDGPVLLPGKLRQHHFSEVLEADDLGCGGISVSQGASVT